jgi:hypothetical protein
VPRHKTSARSTQTIYLSPAQHFNSTTQRTILHTAMNLRNAWLFKVMFMVPVRLIQRTHRPQLHMSIRRSNPTSIPNTPISFTPQPDYDQNIGSGYLQHVLKHWENYPYPPFIQQADLDPEATDCLHQTEQPGYPLTHHPLFQGSSSYNYNLTGIGAQFSRKML